MSGPQTDAPADRAHWAALEEELALWAATGQTPEFWWRDDDTCAAGATLDRLIGLSDTLAVPLHLAVIPQRIDASLRPRLRLAGDVHVMQHGFAHINHAASGTGASEIGQARALDLIRADLAEGWARLKAADLPQTLTGLTPPWNRIGAQVVPHLPDWGYRVLSTFGPREGAAVAGLVQVNAHVDPIRWKTGAVFRGVAKTLAQVTDHLHAKRTGKVDGQEPTGFLTHHLQTDAATWAFMGEFLSFANAGRGCRWIRLRDLEGVAHG